MNSLEIETAKELLQQKVHLFEMLLSCAKQQSESYFLDDPTKYENIIQTRAGIIDEINKIDMIVHRNLEALGIEKSDLETQIETINSQIVNIARQIINEDQKSRSAMDDEFQLVKNKLQLLQKGKKGMSAYGANIGFSPGGAYTDSKR